MDLSQREQELLNFIKSEEKVTIKQIEEVLSVQHTGALGALKRLDLVEKKKLRQEKDPNAVYSITKMITYYMLKKESK